MAYAVLTTSRMENKNIDALNRVGLLALFLKACLLASPLNRVLLLL